MARAALPPDSATSARPIHAGAPPSFSLMAQRYEFVERCASPNPKAALPDSLQIKYD